MPFVITYKIKPSVVVYGYDDYGFRTITFRYYHYDTAEISVIKGFYGEHNLDEVERKMELAKTNIVEKKKAQRIIKYISTLSIPVIPKEITCGLDGICYELKIEKGMNVSEYKWWEELPEDWKPLKRIVNYLTKLSNQIE